MSVSTTTAPDWGISPLQNFASQYEEIVLSQGALFLSETDLLLPGINGLDLAITRTYDSRRFSDKSSYGGVSPLGGQMTTAWGRGMAKGWGLNVMMRAYILDNALETIDGGKVGDPRYKKIMIESVEGIAEYYYDAASGAYLSKQPNNRNRAYFADALTYTKIMEPYSAFDMLGGSTKIIRLEMSNGQTYIFSEILMRYVIGNKQNINDHTQPWGRIEGYGLTAIHKGMSSIQFSYEKNAGIEDRNLLSWPLLPVAGMHLFEMADYIIAPKYGGSFNTGYQNITYYKRINTITDSRGQIVRLSYLNDSAPRSESYGIVSKITYKGVNGSDATISYSYDAGLRLTAATKQDLPSRLYGYTPIDLGFGASGRGSILSTIQHEGGAQIQYGYHNTGTYPVVISKTITDLGKDTRAYSYTYTNMSGEPYKRQAFTPSWKPKGSYFSSTWDKPDSYFPSVTVSGGPNIQSLTSLFEDDLPISETMGKYKRIYRWDKDLLRLLDVTQFSDQRDMRKTVYEDFDLYGFPTQIREYEGGVAVRLHNTKYAYPDLVYADRPFFRWGRVYYFLGMPVEKQVKELATNKVRMFNYTLQDFLVTDVYEGETIAGKKLKTLSYDNRGRVTRETSYGPWGQTTATTVYEELSTVYRVTQTVNGKSGVSEYSPHTGHLLKKTDANGLVVSYTYDSYGRPIKTKNPDGTEQSIAYSADLKTTTVTAFGLSTRKTVDGLGRVVLIDRPTGMQDEKFEYYYAGLPSKVYRQENGVWVLKKSYTYDSYLRKTSTTSPDFGTTTYAYDTPVMNATTVTDSQGRKTIQYQNEAGQTTKQNFSATGVSEDTVFSYNGFGQLLQTTDARGLTHGATYDSYGRILQSNHVNSSQKRSEPIYSSAGAGIVTGTNIYDRAGMLYRNYSYDYDNEGRITALKVDNVTKETTVYDTATNAKGMIASVENEDAKTEYTYDSLSRLIEEKTTVKAANNRVMAIGYGYNSEGALASISYPDGQSINYGYDSLKRVNAVSYGSTNKAIVGYTYNENGTIKNLQYGNGVKIAYSYERNILLTKITVTNAQNTVIYSQDYSYDTPGKMTGTQHSNYFGSYAAGHPSANVRRDYSYTAKDELAAVTLWSQPKYGYSYDANGNHKRYETAQNNGYTADNMVIDTNEDKILQKTNKDGSRTGYSYDAMGNLTTKMVYVAGGSVVSQRADYVYNYQDQLSEVRRNGEKIASYGYDTKRQRVYRQVYPTVAGGSAPHDAALREAKDGRLYMWDSAGRSIGEAEATTGRIVVRYVYSGNEKVSTSPELRKEQALPGFSGSVLVRLCEHAGTITNPRVDAQTGARSWYYFINNAQGTPVLILDESGGTISRVNLDEWGNVGQLIGPASEVNYTGKKPALSQQGSGCASLCDRRILVSPLWGEHGEANLQSPETGLYYFNQRYYDPSLGRFLTEDPAGQGLNPYAYAGNSPLMYVDPDGEWFFLAPLIGAMVQGAIYGAITNAVINVSVAAATGGNLFDAAVSGAINGAIGGALSGGVGFGIGAIGSSVAGAVGMSGQWVAAMNGLNTAMTTVQAYNIGQGIYEGARTGNWGQFAGAAAQGALMGLDSMGMNPIADFARGVGRSAAGLVDSRFGYKNHIITESSNSDGKSLYQETHFDDLDLSSAKNLSEELAIQEAVGRGEIIPKKLGDPRYKGMDKWEYVHRGLDGGNINIHYVKDPNANVIHDIKVKRH